MDLRPTDPTFNTSRTTERKLVQPFQSNGKEYPLILKFELSEANKRGIFERGISDLDSNCAEAVLILQNLRRLLEFGPYNDITSAFSLRNQSTIIGTVFRLIFVNEDTEADIDVVQGASKYGQIEWTLDDNTKEPQVWQYLAVSHCWRSKEFGGDGRLPYEPWPFSRSFVKAILDERGRCYPEQHRGGPQDERFRKEGIWIDKMCINQEDDAEKQDAIPMMDIVYKSCRKLLIVIDDVCFSEDQVEVMLKADDHVSDHLSDYIGKEKIYQAGNERDQKLVKLWHELASKDSEVWNSVLDLIEGSRWWQRSWCWHEFQVHQPRSEYRHMYWMHNAVVIAGGPEESTVKVKWLLIQNVHAALSRKRLVARNNPERADRFSLISRWTLDDNRHNLYQIERGRGSGSQRPSIVGIFNTLAAQGCSVPLDMISITFNSCAIGLQLKYVRLSPSSDETDFLVAQTRILGSDAHKFVRFVVCAVALAAGEITPLTFRLDLEGSMWAWLGGGRAVAGLDKFTLTDILSVHSMDQTQISLDLFFFENWIDHVSPGELDEQRSTLAKIGDVSFLDEARLCARLSFLAALWAGGTALLHRLAQSLRKIQPTEVNLDYARAAAHFVAGYPHPHSSAIMEDALFFLSWLMTPVADYYILGATASTARITCTNDGSIALVSGMLLRNPDLKQFPVQEVRIAMPTALVRERCDMLRGWVLQPAPKAVNGIATNKNGLSVSADGRWRILGKALILGMPEAGINVPSTNDMVKLCEDQTVTM